MHSNRNTRVLFFLLLITLDARGGTLGSRLFVFRYPPLAINWRQKQMRGKARGQRQLSALERDYDSYCACVCAVGAVRSTLDVRLFDWQHWQPSRPAFGITLLDPQNKRCAWTHFERGASGDTIESLSHVAATTSERGTRPHSVALSAWLSP